MNTALTNGGAVSIVESFSNINNTIFLQNKAGKDKIIINKGGGIFS